MNEAELLGRGPQLRILHELLGRLPDAGGAMVLQGGPGVGKSALLRAVAERARAAGWRLLEVTGGADDTPFSGLRTLLRPMFGTADSLPAGQGEILRAAFAAGSGPPPETSRVALAAFNLLTARAAEQPTVLIADDTTRLDGPTRDVLAFMARRASDNPIVVLAALRGGRTLPGVPVLDVLALDEPSARRLLARHADALPQAVRERILGEAFGNPLALVELPAAWHPTGPPGSWAHLPVNATLASAFATGLGELPDRTRDALPADERALLLDTLEAWFDSGGSAGEAAKVLYVHPNTVRTRLRRIAERTGRSLTDPRGITELSLALRAVRQTPRPPSSESTGAN
ncbi:helix-turn-helix domain-containing protein [Streptomyces sp. STR69]|uniref:helix-turn-helix domain-containing protein n=1 Tax=Streptomyces sp. STR69 TaxID=1796942 RepID=UPI002905C59D|nr:helix-turn-helix domain-containing protein [Streptomyces sp. STR69]